MPFCIEVDAKEFWVLLCSDILSGNNVVARVFQMVAKVVALVILLPR